MFEHASPAALGRLRARVTFPVLAGATTMMTLTLVSLGVYTAATGSGLACSAQWPLCDGGVLPNSVPSFIEWFHRLVAMITGGLIVATAAWAWWTEDRSTRLAATVAVALLPLQVGVGAVTVTVGGLVPGGYSPPVHAVHLLTALAILTALAVVTIRAFEDSPTTDRSHHALLASGALTVLAVPFSRLVPVPPYSPAAQATFLAVALGGYVSLLAAVRWHGLAGRPRPRALAAVGATALLVAVVLGRDIVAYTPLVGVVNTAAVTTTLVAVGVALQWP